MEDNNKPQRDFGVDTLAGFFVLYIAFGHVLDFYKIDSHNLCPSPYLYFFMPWFFYKGGMFYNAHSDTNKFLKKSFSRLVMQFIKWTIIACIAYNGLALLLGEPIRSPFSWFQDLYRDGSIYENKPLWFLLSLFLVRVVSTMITTSERSKLTICLVIFGSIVIATLSNAYDIHNPLWLFNTLSGLVYFLFGYLYGKNYSVKSFLPSLFIWIFISTFFPPGVSMRANKTVYGCYYLWWIYSLAGIYSVNYLIRLVPSKVLENKYNVLKFAGIHSMDIYVVHWIIIVCISLMLR